MNWRYLLIFVALVSVLFGADSPATSNDMGRLLQALAPKFVAFEHDTHAKIAIHTQLKSPTEEEDSVPGAYMHALATKRGLSEKGVLIGYFADEGDWRVWIGDELVERFTGKKGTVKELTDNKAIHDVKDALLETAEADGDALAKKAAGEREPTKAERAQAQGEALVEALRMRLTLPAAKK